MKSKYQEYKKAFELLLEVWAIPLSDDTWNNIGCELADDITAVLNGNWRNESE